MVHFMFCIVVVWKLLLLRYVRMIMRMYGNHCTQKFCVINSVVKVFRHLLREMSTFTNRTHWFVGAASRKQTRISISTLRSCTKCCTPVTYWEGQKNQSNYIRERLQQVTILLRSCGVVLLSTKFRKLFACSRLLVQKSCEIFLCKLSSVTDDSIVNGINNCYCML